MEVATGQLNNKQQNILSFYIMLSIEMIHIKFATFTIKNTLYLVKSVKCK